MSIRRGFMTSLEGVPRMAVVGAALHVGVAGGSRGLPLLTLANGTLMARRSCQLSSRAPAHACPADIPSAADPPARGAGQAKPVKMQRPAGRTILTGLAWFAGLVPGRRQTG
jgi:hypothetical protein